eukprot:scaffold208682_cov26-Prasinocladus_malaysianus.AAC.1
MYPIASFEASDMLSVCHWPWLSVSIRHWMIWSDTGHYHTKAHHLFAYIIGTYWPRPIPDCPQSCHTLTELRCFVDAWKVSVSFYFYFIISIASVVLTDSQSDASGRGGFVQSMSDSPLANGREI